MYTSDNFKYMLKALGFSQNQAEDLDNTLFASSHERAPIRALRESALLLSVAGMPNSQLKPVLLTLSMCAAVEEVEDVKAAAIKLAAAATLKPFIGDASLTETMTRG